MGFLATADYPGGVSLMGTDEDLAVLVNILGGQGCGGLE